MKSFWLFGFVIAALCLTGCATPVTTLMNKKTGEVVKCGGKVSGSLIGGIAGYNMQQRHDEDCVSNYLAAGYEPI